MAGTRWMAENPRCMHENLVRRAKNRIQEREKIEK